MKIDEFNPTPINTFVNREIDAFVQEKELNSFIKYIYKIGAPKREKTYLITQIGKMLGYKDKKILFPFAAAAELMMASAMNADDSVDNNKARYGGKALWLTLGKDKTHMISNYIYGLLFEILKKHRPETSLDREAHQKLYDLLMDYFFVGHYAQYRTMSLGQRLKKFTLKQSEELAYQKTGILFEFCTYVPALLANQYTKELREFGRLFGVALQYSSDRRDFLNQNDDIDKIKVRYEDLYTHQPNLVLVLTAQSALLTKAEKDFFINTWISVKRRDETTERKIFSIIQKSGAIEKSNKILNEIGTNLKKLINVLPKKDICSDLIDLVDRVCRI